MAWFKKSSQTYDAGKDEDGNLEVFDDKILRKFKAKNFQVIKKVEQIGLPKQGEQLRLITTHSFNTISIISFIAESEIIKDAVFVIFAINIQAAKLLIELKEKGHFQNCKMIISSIRNAGQKDKSKAVELLKDYFDITFITSHAKISLLKTEKNHYCIEGSGNFSWNARLEQYIIDNDIEIWEFSESWMKEAIKL